jgi:hypothetical protein
MRGDQLSCQRRLTRAIEASLIAFPPDIFPSDFMFRLTKEEKNQLVTNCDRLERLKYSSALPSVFTEQGVAMLSTVLFGNPWSFFKK